MKVPRLPHFALGIVAGLLGIFHTPPSLCAADPTADPVLAAARCHEASLVADIVAPLREAGLLDPVDAAASATTGDVSRYASHVRMGRWTEIRPDESQRETAIAVEAEIWTDAIQAALNENPTAYVPHRPRPYYIDRPLILRSGHRLCLAPRAEIRLKPGANCCMVRNEHLLNGQTGAVTLTDSADHDIVITGGIWTTLATTPSQPNGNVQGYAFPGGSPPANGVVVLSHVRRVRVTDLTLRQCRYHGVQFSNCSSFLVDRIRFEDHRRDGVHVNGPASYGVIQDIRNVHGVMGDDLIALNAWDWKNTVMTFGPIHHVLVEGIAGEAGAAPHGPEGRSEIRLLAGTKRFDDGRTLDCNIERCVIRSVTGIHTFKMYDQPNLELGRDRDFADPIGTMKDLTFGDLRIDRPTGGALFQIHSNVSGMTVHDVALGFDPTSAPGGPWVLVQVGPISMTCKINPNDPASWVEVFSPDKDCVVEALRVSGVTAQGRPLNQGSLVRAIRQSLNRDYPKTTPRGGTGKGILK
jgi:hypothetical protein